MENMLGKIRIIVGNYDNLISWNSIIHNFDYRSNLENRKNHTYMLETRKIAVKFNVFIKFSF